MKTPKKLKVGAHTVKVIKTTHLEFTDCESNTERSKLRIYIDTKYPESMQEENFVHELLHIALGQAGFNEGAEKPLDPNGNLTEEQLVCRLAPVLYPIIEELIKVNRK